MFRLQIKTAVSQQLLGSQAARPTPWNDRGEGFSWISKLDVSQAGAKGGSFEAGRMRFSRWTPQPSRGTCLIRDHCHFPFDPPRWRQRGPSLSLGHNLDIPTSLPLSGVPSHFRPASIFLVLPRDALWRRRPTTRRPAGPSQC